MRLSRTLGLVACCVALMSVTSAFGNLVFNGDFSFGTAAFTTQYSLVSQNTTEGQAGLVTDPNLAVFPWNSGFTSFNDKSGSGLMLVANGSTSVIATPLVWGQAITTEVGKTYDVSFWAANASGASTGSNAAKLTLAIDFLNPVTIDLSAPAGSPAGTWVQGTGQFTASSTTSILRINNSTASAVGNDFAIDNISVTVVPEPSSLALLGIGSLLGLGVYTRRRRKSA